MKTSVQPVFSAPGSTYTPPQALPPRRPQTKSQRRSGGVPNSPEDRRHAAEAVEVIELLESQGVIVEKGAVAPTRDRAGFIRLTFGQLYELLGVEPDNEEGRD